MLFSRCTRQGCGKEFDPASNTESSCTFHRGGAVFHEGLKSWSCCNTVNKPVTDFDDFIAIVRSFTFIEKGTPAEMFWNLR